MVALDSKDAVSSNSVLLWPFLLFIATVTLQNIYLVYTPKFGPGLNYINIILVVCVLAGLSRRDHTAKPPLALAKPVIALFLSYLLAWFVTITKYGFLEGTTLASLKDIFTGIAFYFLAIGLIKTRTDWNRAIIATLVPLPYMFRVFRNQLQSVFSWHYDDDLRTVAGTFMELGSNEIGAFYAYVSVVLIALVIFVKPIKYRVALGVCLALTIYGLLYSFSRGSYLAFVSGALFFVWLWNKKWAAILVLSVVVATGVFKGFLPISVQERIDSIFVEEEDRDASAQSRVVIWGYAMEEYSKSPVWGIGYGAFKHTGPTGQDTHNYYVKVLTEHGLIGLVIFVWLIARIMQLIRRAIRAGHDPAFHGLALGVAGAAVALFISNMFGDRFTHYPLSAFFWLYLGLLEARMRMAPPSEASAEGEP